MNVIFVDSEEHYPPVEVRNAIERFEFTSDFSDFIPNVADLVVQSSQLTASEIQSINQWVREILEAPNATLISFTGRGSCCLPGCRPGRKLKVDGGFPELWIATPGSPGSCAFEMNGVTEIISPLNYLDLGHDLITNYYADSDGKTRLRKSYYLSRECSFPDERCQRKRIIKIPAGYSYISHAVVETTRNSSNNGFSITSKSASELEVELWCENHKDCAQIIVTFGPRSWIGIDVIVEIKRDQASPPFAFHPNEIKHGVIVGFLTDQGASPGAIEVTNGSTKAVGATELQSGISRLTCAQRLYEACGLAHVKSELAGDATVRVYGALNRLLIDKAKTTLAFF